MRGACLVVLLGTLTWPGLLPAQELTAARTLRAGAVVNASDLAIPPGGAPEAAAIIGQEARVTIYAGRPLHAADFGPPALIDRNQRIMLVYRNGPLLIQAEGRALARGGAGDRITAINAQSRTTVSGEIAPDGTLHVLSDRP